MQVIGYILRNLDHYRRRFWLVAVFSLLYSFASLAIPLLLAEFTSKGLTPARFHQLIVGIMVAIVISLLCAWTIRHFGEALATQFPNYLRTKLFRQLEQQPLDRLARHHTGYTLSMISQMSDRVNAILIDVFWSFSAVVANLSLLIYFTATKAWGLTVLNLALFVAFVIVSTILARQMTALADAMNKKNASFSQHYIDFMSNLFTIKRLGIRDFAFTKLDRQEQTVGRQIQVYQDAHANRWLLLHAIYYTANFVTIGYLLYEIAHGRLAVGILILFIAFYANLRFVIERIAENIITFTEMRVYIRNLNQIIKPSVGGGQQQLPHWQRLQLADISYSYPGNNVRVQIPQLLIGRGQRVCIFGTSGEGKTTILNLLANFLTPQAGMRRLDDADYNQLDHDWLTGQLAFISQEVELFNLSLKENLTLGRQVSEGKLWQLLSDLELADWVRGLDRGLNTVVGEKGLRLSAGQKQRVNLARGILLDRPLYLLDEPTSHLDDATEQAVIAALTKHLAGKTAVIVTHRPAIKALCTQFYEIKRHTLKASRS